MATKFYPIDIEPLDWILSPKSTARPHRPNIICWRDSKAFLLQLIAWRAAEFGQAGKPTAEQRMRLLGSTRQLMTCMVALKVRLYGWRARLQAEALDCTSIDAICLRHTEALGRVDGWEVGGLFSGITQDPESLVATFRMLEKIPQGDLNATVECLFAVGNAAELVALTASE